MANHYTTIAICIPDCEIDFDVDEFNERHKESDLCAIVKPMPEILEQIEIEHHPDGRTHRVLDGQLVEEHMLKNEFGHKDWYEWAMHNWGTYGVEAYQLGGDCAPVIISFESAWSAPSILKEIAEWLNKTYGFTKVEFVGVDPYDDSISMLGNPEYQGG